MVRSTRICPRYHLLSPVSYVIPIPIPIPIPIFGIMQAHESLRQELRSRPGAVEEALAISEGIPPPSNPATKRAAVEANGGGPSGKRCVPCLLVSGLRSSLSRLSRATNTIFSPTLHLEYTCRSAQATPRRSERSVTRRESRGQQVVCAVVHGIEFRLTPRAVLYS